MTNAMTKARNTAMTSAGIFEEDDIDDLIAGAGGSFGVVSIRGGKWRAKYGGEETLITNEEGEAVPSIPLVILKASQAISKIFYAKKYVEGDDQAPDCYSEDGLRPDPSAPDPQHHECATCPMAMWGSAISEYSGKKIKRCNDSRRLVVVPAAVRTADADPSVLENEQYGGPMLLRVPPASLGDLAKYGLELKKNHPGMSYKSVVTRFGFDPDSDYPKLTFKAVRPLTDDEKATVVDLYNSGAVDNILSSSGAVAEAPKQEPKPKPAAPKKTVDTDFEEEEPAPTKPAAKQAAAKQQGGFEEEEAPVKAAAKKATVKKATVKKVAAAKGDDESLSSALDDITDVVDVLAGALVE
jgi:hypothetical protein